MTFPLAITTWMLSGDGALPLRHKYNASALEHSRHRLNLTNDGPSREQYSQLLTQTCKQAIQVQVVKTTPVRSRHLPVSVTRSVTMTRPEISSQPSPHLLSSSCLDLEISYVCDMGSAWTYLWWIFGEPPNMTAFDEANDKSAGI
jgi:hypothetical protein